jgi:hypothetical protein
MMHNGFEPSLSARVELDRRKLAAAPDSRRGNRARMPTWLAAAVLVLYGCATEPSLAQQPCARPVPVAVPPPTIAGAVATRVPDDVCIPELKPDIPLAYFDDYSWRALIALVWPALDGERGVPDPDQALEQVSEPDAAQVVQGPSLVFETYKADWETFQRGFAPSQWNSTDARWTNAQLACTAARKGDFFLAPSEKLGSFDNLTQFDRGIPTSVLVAQNGTLVRYVAAYNQIEFNQILEKQWYLSLNLRPYNGKLEFLNGSLSVKSSWVDMRNIAHPERFHRRLAWLYDPFSHTCEERIVGLVGIHIVQKTPSRPQWIWSSFEHVDNVPLDISPPPFNQTKSVLVRSSTAASCPPRRIAMYPFTFNDGSGSRMPPDIPPGYSMDEVQVRICPPSPVNVERLTPINESTKRTNAIWQDKLRGLNSVWQYYQLVVTQWPDDTDRCGEEGCGAPNHTIPGSAKLRDSAFANTTMETWNQKDIGTGCMSCHNAARAHDFVWSLAVNAWPLDYSPGLRLPREVPSGGAR